ncbi:hypothetical protein VQ574_21360 (plasmid) [Stutzerimonas frequens]|uniref:hypothetical protein n=1 Tax=Stutzerimonas frequens TaxID=2968969 RepID=UPI002DBDC9F6|nr:hypothetical protein [Stutzerimonas frequens]WRW29275.1 hypothetical protein VQ574_21360 [Stutzerimonas frequens]
MKKVKVVSANLVNLLKRASYRISLVATVLSAPLMLVATPAHAFKLSDLFNGIKSEWGMIVPVVLLLIMGLGVIFAGWAVISAIIAKKNQEPLKWQVAGLIGGFFAIVLPLILLAGAGSLTNEQGNAEGVMSELNINY